MLRTHLCGEVRAEHTTGHAGGGEVALCGWVDRVRDHGGVLFVDLRDYSGVVQVVVHPEDAPGAFAVAETLRPEFVARAVGPLRVRPEGTVNPDLPTGEVEVAATRLEVLNPSAPLPLSLDDRVETDEVVRLRHRPLDLRRPRMQANLRLRARMNSAIRQAMDAAGFVEVETPTLIRSTPEGARDYLVPSRLTPGHWYALPQSPQLFKQLLMVGGVDRYYQIVRCWRDEDLRADRQFEFMQLDLEASFADEADVRGWVETAVAAAARAAGRDDFPAPPYPRMPWSDAMGLYGSDKPDLRAGPPLVDLGDVFAATGFRAFAATLESGGALRGWRCAGGGDRSRARLDALVERAQALGAKGLVWMVVEADGTLRSPVAKFLSDAEMESLRGVLDAAPGDLLLLVADDARRASAILGRLRLELAAPAGHGRDAGLAPLWVVDFPLFEPSEDGDPRPAHHPFTSPVAEDVPLLGSDPLVVRSRAYDLVVNGVEFGSGSVRIHDRDLQEAVFAAMDVPAGEAQSRFGFLLDAFRYGAPPHAGFALGLDRFVAVLADEPSIREVIAFPKTQSGQDPMTGAPAAVEDALLAELGVALTPSARRRLAGPETGTGTGAGSESPGSAQ